MADYIVEPRLFNGNSYDILHYTTGAKQVTYDNTTSGLEATNVQNAIDEISKSATKGASTFQLYMMGGFLK